MSCAESSGVCLSLSTLHGARACLSRCAPLAGTTRANDSVFPVAPLALGSNQLRPLDDPDALVAGDPLPGEGPEDLSGHDDDNPLPE